METWKANVKIRFIIMAIIVLFFTASPDTFLMRPGLENGVQTFKLETETKSVAIFPIRLQLLDDEALSGTSIEVAVFNKELAYIGPGLFKDADSLTDVYIPKNTKYIGEHAIPSGALIHVVRNSYARKWAKDNGYQYIVDNIWHESVCPEGIRLYQLMLLFYIVIPIDAKKYELWRRSAKLYVKSMRPQDRAELNPIDYRFP